MSNQTLLFLICKKLFKQKVLVKLEVFLFIARLFITVHPAQPPLDNYL